MPMTREEREEAKVEKERPAPEEAAATAPLPRLDPHARGIDREAFFAARDKGIAKREARFDSPEARSLTPASPEKPQPTVPAAPRPEPQEKPIDRAAEYEAVKPKGMRVIGNRRAAVDEAQQRKDAERAANEFKKDRGERFDR